MITIIAMTSVYVNWWLIMRQFLMIIKKQNIALTITIFWILPAPFAWTTRSGILSLAKCDISSKNTWSCKRTGPLGPAVRTAFLFQTGPPPPVNKAGGEPCLPKNITINTIFDSELESLKMKFCYKVTHGWVTQAFIFV